MDTGRDHAGERLRHHIGGIEPAAEPDFEQQRIRRIVGEQQEGRRGLDFEHCDGRVAIRLLTGFQRGDKFGVGHQDAAAALPDPVALVHPHQVGRGVDMHARTGSFQHGAHERHGRSLAIGAGNMDDREGREFPGCPSARAPAAGDRATGRCAWDGASAAAP